MNFKKSIIAVIVSVVCVLVNMGGKFLAEVLALPVMLDSIGTMLCAYLYGPVCGAIVGGAANIAYLSISPISCAYSLTNIAAGIIIGLCAKRKMFDNLFGMLSTGFLVTISSVLISTPLNFLFSEGLTGNKWSDGVINLLNALGANRIFSAVCGEFYLDFVDKVLSVLLVAGIIKLYRRFASKRLKKKVLEMISVSLAVMFCFVSLPANASANLTGKKQDTFLQTVYDAENGLPGGIANDIAQTKDGILWVATYGGLYRYNGSEFRLMSNFESVKNANCLFTDNEGRLWIGTNDSGLSICVNNEISNILNSESGLPSDSVRYIAQGENGIYYVGTSDALALVTLSNGLKVTEVIPEITYAKSISSNGKYVAAVSDTGRLFLLEGDTIVARTYLSWYSCCQFSEDGKLYAGTISGEVEEYDVSEGSFSWKGSMKCGDLGSINSL
ncbi:MAG: two-component regulator propeller domain-containing protein, partial [Oscillospiraceae bacterium]